MKNIEFLLGNKRIITFTKLSNVEPFRASDFYFTKHIYAAAEVLSSDEIVIIFYEPNKLKGCIKLTMDQSLNYELKDKVQKAIDEYGLNPSTTLVYFAPALTFSHINAERSVLEKLIDDGFNNVAKASNGVDFLDLHMLNYDILRSFGFKIENTYFSDFDTYENEKLLYSKKRGDKKQNLTTY